MTLHFSYLLKLNRSQTHIPNYTWINRKQYASLISSINNISSSWIYGAPCSDVIQMFIDLRETGSDRDPAGRIFGRAADSFRLFLFEREFAGFPKDRMYSWSVSGKLKREERRREREREATGLENITRKIECNNHWINKRINDYYEFLNKTKIIRIENNLHYVVNLSAIYRLCYFTHSRINLNHIRYICLCDRCTVSLARRIQ